MATQLPETKGKPLVAADEHRQEKASCEFTRIYFKCPLAQFSLGLCVKAILVRVQENNAWRFEVHD
jgi:hypothetical protein